MDQNQTIVKLKTEYYHNGKSAVIKKSLTTLKRKSSFDLLNIDIGNIDAETVLTGIVNINDVEDGEYILTITNVSHDYETGHIDDYEYILIPCDVTYIDDPMVIFVIISKNHNVEEVRISNHPTGEYILTIIGLGQVINIDFKNIDWQDDLFRNFNKKDFIQK